LSEAGWEALIMNFFVTFPFAPLPLAPVDFYIGQTKLSLLFIQRPGLSRHSIKIAVADWANSKAVREHTVAVLAIAMNG